MVIFNSFLYVYQRVHIGYTPNRQIASQIAGVSAPPGTWSVQRVSLATARGHARQCEEETRTPAMGAMAMGAMGSQGGHGNERRKASIFWMVTMWESFWDIMILKYILTL